MALDFVRLISGRILFVFHAITFGDFKLLLLSKILTLSLRHSEHKSSIKRGNLIFIDLSRYYAGQAMPSVKDNFRTGDWKFLWVGCWSSGAK